LTETLTGASESRVAVRPGFYMLSRFISCFALLNAKRQAHNAAISVSFHLAVPKNQLGKAHFVTPLSDPQA
jgi:hypothetical protein